MKTYSAREGEVERRWFVVDAEGQTLGRLASHLAVVLQGKNKPVYTRHIDTGDFVVVVNAAAVKVTGRKETAKTYTSFSGYIGGQKRETVAGVRGRKPELLVERAVRGMIPHNRLGRQIIGKLKVYAGAEHPHAAQQPVPYAL